MENILTAKTRISYEENIRLGLIPDTNLNVILFSQKLSKNAPSAKTFGTKDYDNPCLYISSKADILQ